MTRLSGSTNAISGDNVQGDIGAEGEGHGDEERGKSRFSQPLTRAINLSYVILGNVRVTSTYVFAAHRLTGMPTTQETVIQTPVMTNGICSDNVQGGGIAEEEEHSDKERGKSRFL